MNLRNSLAIITSLFFIAGSCYEEPDPDIASFTITPSKPLIEGNGFDGTKLTIQLDSAKVKPFNGRSLTITTSLGYFNDTKDAKTLPLTTDARGTAIAYFRSEMAGTAVITVSFTGVVRYQDISVSPKAVGLTLTPTSTTLEGNGETTTIINVKITNTPQLYLRTVALATTLGLFSNGQQSISVVTDKDGTGSASLKSTVAGKALIAGTLGTDAAANTIVTFTQKKDTLEFTLEKATLAADGASTSKVEIRIKNASLISGRAINLATTLGTFANGQASASLTTLADGKATTYIKSENSGIAIITATLSTDVIQATEITFIKAGPEALYVFTDVLEATSGPANLLTVKVKLTRSSGKPSIGYVPTLQAFDNSGVSIGISTVGSASSADGISEIKFAIPDKTFTGQVKFKATLTLPGVTPIVSDLYGPVIFKAGS